MVVLLSILSSAATYSRRGDCVQPYWVVTVVKQYVVEIMLQWEMDSEEHRVIMCQMVGLVVAVQILTATA